MTVGSGDAPRVLAIADGAQSHVAAWRVHAPLAALKRSGRIADYVVTDSTLSRLPRRGAVDVVWLQRAVDRHLVRRLVELIPHGFLLDIDDHLLCRPEYLEPEEFPRPEPVIEALAAASVVTVTSRRLGDLLALRAGLNLDERLVVCPNGACFTGRAPRQPRRPEVLLLTQGHRLALTASAADVLAAIGEFAARRELPICYLGPPLERLSPLAARVLPGVVHGGETDFAHYHELLASLPSMLAVAPLETTGTPETIEFVAGKSDVKMVDYGGFGHPAVYSAAPPYLDSDLKCGRTAANTYLEWSKALERTWEDGWQTSADEEARVRRLRRIDHVADRCWAGALDAARLDTPIECCDLARLAERVGARVRRLRSRVARHVWRARRCREAKSDA